MPLPPRRLSRLPLALLLFLLLPLWLLSPAGTPLSAERAVSAAPLACPAAPAGLPNTVERTNFCIYYNSASTTLAQATTAADHVEDYWERYDVDFGFLAPSVLGAKLEVQLTVNGGCNGATSSGSNVMDTWTGCYTNPESIQKVLGHELFHRVQYSYDGSEVRWFKEGTARAMEDLAFTNIDNWATTLTAVSSSFNKQVNTYLSGTTANEDITSDNQRYNSALWWKYFTEQYGSIMTEPQRGVDAMVELWEAADGANDVAALNNALAALGAGVNFDGAFRRFAVANWTKDLTGVPDASYNYADEDQAGNGAPYGPLVPLNGGTITPVTAATWNAQTVDRYGIRYYSATPDPTCQVITAQFTRTAGGSEFYHVVTQAGSAFRTHVEGSGASWTQSFLNNGITRVIAILGGQNSSATVNVSLSCTTPVLEIELPSTGAPAYVGASASPDDMVVQLSVTNGVPTGPVVGGLSNNDFRVEVGGVLAAVVGGGQVQEEYFILVDTPTQGANGPYDLEVSLEAPGTATIIASDTEADAVLYDNTNADHVIVTDVSGSMSSSDKMTAARNAAHLFVDASNSSEGLGLVSYSTNVVDTLGVQFATLPHRNSAHTEIDSYVPLNLTSIGDGLNQAVALRAASPTGNTRCQFTLLSDGMENDPLYWANVQAAVVATGCPVMTIALGPASNELLMQNIATATGGVAYYNEVYVSSQESGETSDLTELDLGDSYVYALCEGQNCERLLSERGSLDYAQSALHTFDVDSSLTSLDVVLDWRPYFRGPSEAGQDDFILQLQSPSGIVFDPSMYDFIDNDAGHAGYHIVSPEVGTWTIGVTSLFDANDKPYQVAAFGRTPITVELLLPSLQGLRTGDFLPIYAIWRPGGQVLATITPLNGIAQSVRLYDDGQHDDGTAGDGFFGGLYTLVNQAQVVQPVNEGGPTPPAQDEGGYSVHLVATDGAIRREAKSAFAVQEGADSGGDGVPDDFVAQYCPGAPSSDSDLDQLSCSDEYFTGTHPLHSDTDGGGENDGSEVAYSQDPLVPTDDLIEAPDFLQAQPLPGAVLLTYDVNPDYTTLRLYRATSPNGPWTLRVNELPLGGAYTDSASNGTTYSYRLLALNDAGHGSALPLSTPATPSTDPYPPEARVLIDDGAPVTADLPVILSFEPYEDSGEPGEPDRFGDITQMKVSHDPYLTGASWQPFQQNLPWTLASVPPGGIARVYVRFRDAAGNESVATEVGQIVYDPAAVTGHPLWLPLVRR